MGQGQSGQRPPSSPNQRFLRQLFRAEEGAAFAKSAQSKLLFMTLVTCIVQFRSLQLPYGRKPRVHSPPQKPPHGLPLRALAAPRWRLPDEPPRLYLNLCRTPTLSKQLHDSYVPLLNQSSSNRTSKSTSLDGDIGASSPPAYDLSNCDGEDEAIFELPGPHASPNATSELIRRQPSWPLNAYPLLYKHMQRLRKSQSTGLLVRNDKSRRRAPKGVPWRRFMRWDLSLLRLKGWVSLAVLMTVAMVWCFTLSFLSGDPAGAPAPSAPSTAAPSAGLANKGRYRTSRSSKYVYELAHGARVRAEARERLESESFARGLGDGRDGAAGAAGVQVELGLAGLAVPLETALDSRLFPENWALLATDLESLRESDGGNLVPGAAGHVAAAGGRQTPISPAACPTAPTRLFLGIVTRCCDAQSLEKRRLIRETWVHEIKAHWRHVITYAFLVAQPDPDRYQDGLEVLAGEASAYGDVVVVPGVDTYRNLPNKSIRLLQYALSSPCNFTHIGKVDDDVFLRPNRLLWAMTHPGNDTGYRPPPPPGTPEPPPLDSLLAWPRKPIPGANYSYSAADPATQPVATGLFMGRIFNPKKKEFEPDRTKGGKWYLSLEELPEENVPRGVRYPLGWAYMLSRDVAAGAMGVVRRWTENPESARPWWRRVPWEDVVVGALVMESGVGTYTHHDAFKTGFQGCGPETAVKHLDIDALNMLRPMHELEQAGVWRHREIPCSTGDYLPGNHTQWLRWRNAQPDVAVVGKYG